jgi:signal transduction histidine kinase
MKLIFFDMGLAIESYINAKEVAIRKHRDAIHELRTEQRVTKSILENAPIGIVSLSEDFVCLECNDQFVEIIDATGRDQVVGKLLFDLAPHLRSELFETVINSGQPCRRTADLLCLSILEKTELEYWDWAAWPVKDDSGKIHGLVAMFSNASDRVHLHQQREDFVATLTHDLKTPVLATNRAVRYLIEGDFGPVSESQKEILETILQSNTALYSLVQTLLDVYRFDSGVKELHLTSCNLASIVTQLVTEIMPLAQEKGVELTAMLPADAQEVKCDEDEIRRVIQNLVDNSLKFTPTGGIIVVSMDQADDKTTISVSDTGKGITEENKPKLFQRFWQAGSPGRYYASTGLGLYLCRRIVEGHGGRIWCDSTLGQGSTFHFQLVS